MRKCMLVIGVLALFATLSAEAGVNLKGMITGENPSMEFRQFFLDFNSAFRGLYKKESSQVLVMHEFMMVEYKGPAGWSIIMHPWMGMKYLDRLGDKEFQEFTWRVEGKLLENPVTRKKKAEEAASWLLQKAKRLDELYLDDVRDTEKISSPGI